MGKEINLNFAGTCAICFNAVAHGEEMRVRPGKRTFHKECAERYPNAHYLKLERQLAAREEKRGGGENATIRKAAR